MNETLKDTWNHNSAWLFFKKLASKGGVTEVIFNDDKNIFIERQGDLIALRSEVASEDYEIFPQLIATFNDKNFDREHPILDGTMPDGSRVNMVHSFYTGKNHVITIRRYLRRVNSLSSSQGYFGVTPKITKLITSLVNARFNILVTGGTNVGKTTFLNMLLNELSPNERVVTIEDTRELYFQSDVSVRLEAKQDMDFKQSVSIRDLVKNALRMRPDRIVIGEIRGAEAYDLLQALNTGHQGCLSSLHANSTVESLSRLENLFYLSGINIPLRICRRQILNGIDFIVHLTKTPSGERILSQLTELTNMEGETITSHDILIQDDDKVLFTGLVPVRMKQLMKQGLGPDFFINNESSGE